jgi:RNA polymerase sigma-70 factor, ECF subfamily
MNRALSVSFVETRMADEINLGSATDSDLIWAASNGDRSAFGELYRRYARMVHGLVLARVPPDLAEDVVQDVFLRAMTRLPGLRDKHHFGGWIAKIARNHIIDLYRNKPKHLDVENEMEIAVPETTSSESEARAILAAINTLPDAYRETLILRLIEGMTGPEIAAKTGLAHGSVRVNLHRGMKMLRGLQNKASEKEEPRNV